MATRGRRDEPSNSDRDIQLSTNPEDLLRAALEKGDAGLETGRFLVTFRDGMVDDGIQELKARSLSIADARDFDKQLVTTEGVRGVDSVVFPEVGVAVVTGGAMEAHGMSTMDTLDDQGAIEAIEPECFVFPDRNDYLRGFASAVNTLARELDSAGAYVEEAEELEPEVVGATWGLIRCKVPPSVRNGAGIRVAVLDTGMDLGHPDFPGRVAAASSFVGQPPQDLHGHGTHCIGTATGPKAPPGATPRYGIAYGSRVFVGKVLTNSGSGTDQSVLAGMNWAIANRCEVISMSLGSPRPPQVAYTNAGAAALRNGCLIIAAAGNNSSSTGSPANSPTIMSVASLDANLRPSAFSNFGKIEISAPGRDVFSSWPRPRRYNTISGTSMATPHVAGCAALWAQTSPTLRGMNLWRKLQATALRLPFPPSRVGAGLVQAP